MFHFKGTPADSTSGNGNNWRLVDLPSNQDLGKRPSTHMPRPRQNQRRKTEGITRPLLQPRSRSNSSAPTYSRPQDKDDLLPITFPLNRRTPRTLGESTDIKEDNIDSFIPKAWMAKGSKLLKRQKSKQELTSLRTLDWVEASGQARVQDLLDQSSPPDLIDSEMPSTPRWNISEPFNFRHVTHTQPHEVQKLERASPKRLVSEFLALGASQVSQPELRGIKAEDIQREDSPQDDLQAFFLPCPRDDLASLSPFRTSRIEDHAQESPSGPTFPVRMLEHSRPADNFSHPTAAYHRVQDRKPLTPSDTTSHSPSFIEFPGPLDYPIGYWNDGVYDLASPHAVTTDDGRDWNRMVPFSMVKTELAPVKEDDEDDVNRSWAYSRTQRATTITSWGRKKKPLPKTKISFPKSNVTLHWGSDACMPTADDFQGALAHPVSPADDSPYSMQGQCIPRTKISEPSIEDPLDDIPVRTRFSRHASSFSDMDQFWDIASDAINCSYALGAEADSFFDWHRSSIHGEEGGTTPTPEKIQTDAVDTASESSERKSQPASPSPSIRAAKRSSSVYSSPPPSLLPSQTSPSKMDFASEGSNESSFSGIPEAVTPIETMHSAMAGKPSSGRWKGMYKQPHIVPNEFESQADQDDLYHEMYTIDYTQDVPFPLHNVGRIDGSTISNSPRSSRSPLSKSNSQESFWYTQAASNARRPRNAGSGGSLPELMSSKNTRERFNPALDQLTDKLTILTPLGSPTDTPQLTTPQRRRSLVKDAAQNVTLSRVRTPEDPVPLLPASSDVTSPAQDSAMPPPPPPAAGRRMRSGSSASSLSARGSRGSYTKFPPPQTPPARGP